MSQKTLLVKVSKVITETWIKEVEVDEDCVDTPETSDVNGMLATSKHVEQMVKDGEHVNERLQHRDVHSTHVSHWEPGTIGMDYDARWDSADA
ncbi:MAG: hypothetical protein Unbinned767contig1000_9 [Prokaryotic dsDNA virus sp.]|nr:MAG: hypothetical protein Unbinned767contig1000_9 [Prokaryotic dsDNA virus sp.]|tara:strand:+ start:3381 stop:3659 length:279 start_codon:yes stop_codon:yes gene_type:complete